MILIAKLWDAGVRFAWNMSSSPTTLGIRIRSKEKRFIFEYNENFLSIFKPGVFKLRLPLNLLI